MTQLSAKDWPPNHQSPNYHNANRTTHIEASIDMNSPNRSEKVNIAGGMMGGNETPHPIVTPAVYKSPQVPRKALHWIPSGLSEDVLLTSSGAQHPHNQIT